MRGFLDFCIPAHGHNMGIVYRCIGGLGCEIREIDISKKVEKMRKNIFS
jgi:hypothetical protein